MNVAPDKVAAESRVHYLEPNERKKERTANAGLFLFLRVLRRRQRSGSRGRQQSRVSPLSDQLTATALLSNADFCKAQLIRSRNERLAKCDSPHTLSGTSFFFFFLSAGRLTARARGGSSESG